MPMSSGSVDPTFLSRGSNRISRAARSEKIQQDQGDAKEAECHAYVPVDIRQTVRRFAYPAPRQRMVVGEDGTLTNSADKTPRGMPPYLLLMDLAFAQLFTVTAESTIGIVERPQAMHDNLINYFFVNMSCIWVWTKITWKYTLADPEDVSSEVNVYIFVMITLYMVYQVEPCFSRVEDTIDDGAGAQRQDYNQDDSCADFVVSFVVMRVYMLLMSVYLACTNPRHLRSQLTLDLLSMVSTILSFAVLFGINLAVNGESSFFGNAYLVSGFVFAVTLADYGGMVLSAKVQVARVKGMDIPMWLEPFTNDRFVPMDIGYLEKRYERLIIITTGNIIGSVMIAMRRRSYEDDYVSDRGKSITMFMAVPWIVFLVKVLYFDLTQYPKDKKKHPMRISWQRSLAWTVVHNLLYATILLMSTAIRLKVRTNGQNKIAGAAFAFSLIGILMCTSSIQLLFRGEGHNSRKIGKHKRMYLRACSSVIVLIFGVLLVTGVAFTDENDANQFFFYCVAIFTANVGVELWGIQLKATAEMVVEMVAGATADATAEARAAVVAAGARAAGIIGQRANQYGDQPVEAPLSGESAV